MSILSIYHFEGDRFRSFSVEAAQNFPEGYRLVAQIPVSAAALEQFGVEAALSNAFHLTQHGDEPWTDNPAIQIPSADRKAVAEARAKNAFVNSSVVLRRRSTSVGDVVSISGDRFVIAPVGFTRLTPEVVDGFLTIEGGKLVLQPGAEGDTRRFEITSRAQLAQLTGGAEFMVSSSVDFPEEYTTDPVVIALARGLRRA